MNERLQAFAADLSRLTSADAVWSGMSALAEECGFSFCTLTMARRENEIQSSRFMTNLPSEFQHNYCQGGLIEDDPFLTLVCQSMAATEIVTDPDFFPDTNGQQDEFLELTRSFGVKSAICVPVNTNAQPEFGGWVIGGAEDGSEFKGSCAASGDDLQLAGLLAFERMSALAHLERRLATRLSPRERECLLWLSAGQRVAMIAHRMGISESAVTLYIQNARRKLGAQTREQAVAKAILSDEIQP